MNTKDSLESLIKPFYNPYAPPLTDKELEAAKREVVSFTRVIRSVSEKEEGFAVLSFLKCDSGDSYVKLRGISQTKEGCNKIATKVLKRIDSKIPLVYVQAGAWIPVTNHPKRIATERFKVVDGALVPDANDEIDKTEKVLEQYYQDEDAEHSRELERRRALLSARTVDGDANAYVVKKMMLHETRKQIKFISEKLRLMKNREIALMDLMAHDSEYEPVWFQEYEAKLGEIGQKPIELDADFDYSEKKYNRVECLNRLKLATDEFNNLKL